MGKLSDLVDGKQMGEDVPEIELLKREDIEAAAQVVHSRVDRPMQWIVASEVDGDTRTVLLFSFVMGAWRDIADESKDGDDLYALLGKSRGYQSGVDVLDEHRHLWLGDDEGYLNYPDLDMLREFFDVIEAVYKGAHKP